MRHLAFILFLLPTVVNLREVKRHLINTDENSILKYGKVPFTFEVQRWFQVDLDYKKFEYNPDEQMTNSIDSNQPRSSQYRKLNRRNDTEHRWQVSNSMIKNEIKLPSSKDQFQLERIKLRTLSEDKTETQFQDTVFRIARGDLMSQECNVTADIGKTRDSKKSEKSKVAQLFKTKSGFFPSEAQLESTAFPQRYSDFSFLIPNKNFSEIAENNEIQEIIMPEEHKDSLREALKVRNASAVAFMLESSNKDVLIRSSKSNDLIRPSSKSSHKNKPNQLSSIEMDDQTNLSLTSSPTQTQSMLYLEDNQWKSTQNTKDELKLQTDQKLPINDHTRAEIAPIIKIGVKASSNIHLSPEDSWSNTVSNVTVETASASNVQINPKAPSSVFLPEDESSVLIQSDSHISDQSKTDCASNSHILSSTTSLAVLNDTSSWSPSWDQSNGGNISVLGHAPTFNSTTLVKACVLGLLGALSLSGNAATLISILRRGRQQSSTVYLLLIHLSVADLIVTWFCIIAEALWTLTVQWMAGQIFCKVIKFLQMFGLYLSTFVLVIIGFDRFCAVRFPMKRVRARIHVRQAITFAWVLSAVLSSPQVAIFSVQKGPFLEEFYQCVTYGFYSAKWQEQLYTSLSLLMMFLLPLFLLIATYAATFASIASRKGAAIGLRSPYETARCKILRKAKVKSLWITVVIVIAFVVCWTPYYISMIISVFLEPDEQLGQDLHDAIFFFGSSTAVINPLVYGAFHLRTRRSVDGSSLSTSRSTLRKFRSCKMKESSLSKVHDSRTLYQVEVF